MRVVYLNAYGNGSTGRIVDSLKLACKENNIDAISIYARENCASPQTSIRCFNKIEFYLDALMTRIFDNHGLNSYFNTKKIIQQLEEFKPDIVHIHNLHGYWINYKLLFSYLEKKAIRVVWTFHDCWHFTGHCTHFDYIGCNKWKRGCFDCQQKGEYPSSAITDGSKRNYSLKMKYFTLIENMTIVTPSEWLKTMVKDSFLGKYEVKVINNGIDLKQFKYLKSDKREQILSKGYKSIILGVAGDWNERKGLSYIIEVANVRPEWMFVVVGNVRDEVRNRSINNNIIYISRTENVKELAEWYSAADVFVNPTLEDTYPTTNLESIACGTPVVTFSTGGSIEIIRKTGYGFITKDRTAASLDTAINSALNIERKYNVFNHMIDAEQKFKEYIDLYINE